jgi:hypothetical protein
VQKKRDKIVKKLKANYWQLTHKFGVKMPKSVNDALQMDQENGNDMWEQAIKKEMGKAKVAYEPNKGGFTTQEIQENKPDTMIGYQDIKFHIIFDVKMDFSRKVRFVAGGHMTVTAASITCASVVSRDSVRLAFLFAA